MSSSLKKIEANRANARKSTGPRTEAGKSWSSRNAVKHGITARTLGLKTDDPDELNALIAGYFHQFAPANQAEADLVASLIVAAWSLRRSWRHETGVLDAQLIDDQQEIAEKYTSVDSDLRAALGFRNSSEKFPNTWHNLDRYQSRLRRQWSSALADLLRLREDPRNSKIEANKLFAVNTGGNSETEEEKCA
jgi:hypothetical protein